LLVGAVPFSGDASHLEDAAGERDGSGPSFGRVSFGSMAFDYSQFVLKTGKTVPFKVNMLPGEPVAHIEHLGESNASYLSDQIAQANAKTMAAAGVSQKKKLLSKKALEELRDKRRDIISKHAVRDLVAKHSDGTPATKADIPMWVAALPPDIIDLIWDFANNAENFRDVIESEPKELAEK
jgi:hypothetical protein